MPAAAKVTSPGFCAVDVAGVPPGNTQEYLAADVGVLKLTFPPVGMLIAGPEGNEVIVP